MLAPTTRSSRRVFIAIITGMGLAVLASFASWVLQPGPEASPVYLLYLPFSLGVPYVLLGAPLKLLSAPKACTRIYSWGAVVLALALSAAWCVVAMVDPPASQSFAQTGLLFGWMAGGTAYQILLTLLVANS